jgi:GTP-binding protein YchF
VLRCFDDDDITHVSGKVDPLSDLETVETELMLADLESLEKRRANLEKRAKIGDKESKAQLVLVDLALAELTEGRPARVAKVSEDDLKAWQGLQLLTTKPVLFIANVGEEDAATGNAYSDVVIKRAAEEGAEAVVISAKIEAELAMLADEERTEYLEELGLHEAGLDRLIHTGCKLLGLRTSFTVGAKEARAWTIEAGWTAPRAAGVIHGDFEKGFIRAETIAFDDYVAHKGESGAKEAGKMRAEGKDYVVQDGDVLHFRFNV